jgi:hypothetical protein
MEKANENMIILNKKKILDSIQNSAIYEEDGIKISHWDGETKDLYVAEITKNDINFIGILNDKLQRDGYCVNNYINNEKYFGFFKKDLRNKQGLYIWPPKIENENRLSEFYWGLWRDNLKDDHGVYLWLSEPKDDLLFSNFDNCDLDAYIGQIEMDSYVKGVYLIKRKDNYYLYYGGFDSSGKKNGKDCFYYNSTEDKVLYGTVVNDSFINGFIGQFSEEGEIVDILEVEFDKNHKVVKYLERDEIEKNKREISEDRIFKFRNIIMEKDYFGLIFEKFKQINEFLENNMKDTNIYSDKDGYVNLMKTFGEFNEMSIYKDIQKKLDV